MMRQFCKVVSCGRMSKKLNLCDAHYQRFRKGQSLDKPIRKWKARPYNSICKEENCDEPNFAVGLCRKHYLRNWRRKRAAKLGLLLSFILLSPLHGSELNPLQQLNKLRIEPESDCGKPYSRYLYVYLEYRGDSDLENRIVRFWGKGIYSPYDKVIYSSTKETDIEHLIAREQMHVSGLACNASEQTKRSAITELENLVLSTPEINRGQKKSLDFAHWKPEFNVCFYAAQTVKVKYLYDLSVDQEEHDALKSVIKECKSFEME